MVVRRTTYEDLEEDAATLAAKARASAGASPNTSSTMESGGREGVDGAGGDFGSGGTSGDTPEEGGLGDRLGQYGRIALVAAVVGFKIVEWWTRVEAQVSMRTVLSFICKSIFNSNTCI